MTIIHVSVILTQNEIVEQVLNIGIRIGMGSIRLLTECSKMFSDYSGEVFSLKLSAVEYGKPYYLGSTFFLAMLFRLAVSLKEE